MIDLQEGKVFKIFLQTIDRQGLFGKDFSLNHLGPPADSLIIFLLGIDLPDPSGIAVAGRPQEKIRIQGTKFEIIQFFQ